MRAKKKVDRNLIAQLSLAHHMPRAVSQAKAMLCSKCSNREECFTKGIAPCQTFRRLFRAVLLSQIDASVN